MSIDLNEVTDNEKYKLYGKLSIVPYEAKKKDSDYVYLYHVADDTVSFNPLNKMIRLSRKYYGQMIYDYLTIEQFRSMVKAHCILYSTYNMCEIEPKSSVNFTSRRLNFKWGKRDILEFNAVANRFIHALETLMNKYEVIPSEYQVEKEGMKESES